MKCSDVDRILPDIIDGKRVGGSHDPEIQSHLRSCPDCSELVADLQLIASEARQLSDCEDPPDRVWVRLAADLRAEGLIRDQELASARPVVVPGRSRRWSLVWLAPVAAAILAGGSYVVSHQAKPGITSPVANTTAQQTPAEVAPQAATSQAVAPQPNTQQAGTQQTAGLQELPHVAPPSTSAPPPQAKQPDINASAEEVELSPPTPGEDSQFLSEVSSRAPTMRVTYENQLRAVNNEIRETQAYISRNPGDVDARQHLLDVYQQKAMLYQMALDRIQ